MKLLVALCFLLSFPKLMASEKGKYVPTQIDGNKHGTKIYMGKSNGSKALIEAVQKNSKSIMSCLYTKGNQIVVRLKVSPLGQVEESRLVISSKRINTEERGCVLKKLEQLKLPKSKQKNSEVIQLPLSN